MSIIIQQYGIVRGYSENLAYSAMSSSTDTMMYFMNLLMDDTTETPQNFGHRVKLLNPEFTVWGFGISPYMAANEFAGYKESNVFLSAWPSNGVTFLETLVNKHFKWSAQFLDKYTVNDSTTVSVKCLNTGEKWDFKDIEETSVKSFRRDINSIKSINNRVIFYDKNIVPIEGDIYEITVKNLTDSSGNNTNYTYRTVFKYADTSNYPNKLTNIDITCDENLTKTTTDTYKGKEGTIAKLTAKFNSDAQNIAVKWSSSNKDVVSVTQNGIININKYSSEPVTISVASMSDNSINKTIKIVTEKTNEYTIQYDGNGSTEGKMTNSTHMLDVAQKLNKNEYIRTYSIEYNANYDGNGGNTYLGFGEVEYKFNGWNTKADGTGTAFNDEQTVKNLATKANETIILYAQWIPQAETSFTPKREGYIFGGWYKEPGCINEVFGADGSFILNKDMKVYAKWTKDEFKKGDINGDGKINIKDWNMLYAYINETMKLSSEALQRADVNEDGKINVKDLNRLYEHVTEVNPL